MNKAEKAKELFLAGANCAQAVVGAFTQECRMNQETAFRLASGFGGGMGRLREVCGALTGMFIVADLLYGYSDINDKKLKDAHYALIQKLAAQFKAEAGTIICRELLGLQEKQNDVPISEERTAEYYQTRPCADLVALAAQIMQEYMESVPPIHGNLAH